MDSHLPTSDVEISLSCRSLAGKDLLSKSDPMCVTFIRPFGEKSWVEYHRTEQLTNTHDPQFSSTIQIVYKFEEQQPLRFEIYDCDSSSSSLNSHDFLGYAECNLSHIISFGKIEMKLNPKQKSSESNLGFIRLAAEELQSSKDEVIFKISARDLDRKNWFGKSDPFLEIYKTTEGRDPVLVHRTEEIKNTLKPKWKEFNIPVRRLCNGDHFRALKFVCYDWNSSGDHEIIGEFLTDLKSLLETCPHKFILTTPKKKSKGDSKGCGEIYIENCILRPIYTFVDYILGGTQLFCTFAIDFTASNGDPRHPQSLHFVSDTSMNLYEQAILSVGKIIQDYDSDKQFPVLGFGAKLPGGLVSHEFYVNMNPASPYCDKINGVLDTYKSFIRLIASGEASLYGPTNFASVINHVAKFASAYCDGSSYFILLILTDGAISDMSHTCQAIVKASKLPMSIIIVGVGTADFSAMEQLDGDTIALTAGGQKAVRDIVQFVPFSKFVGSTLPYGDLLAREVLAEIPDQVTGYMKAMKIAPRPKRSEVTPGFVQFISPDSL